MSSKISSIIREKRARTGLSQEEFAKRMKVSANYISLLENGRKTAGAAFLNSFSREFGVPLLLLSEDNKMPKAKNAKEEEIISRLEKLMSDLEDLFIKGATN